MKINKRILHILIGLGLILVAVLLISLGEKGPEIIALVLGISMLIYGVRCLIVYFTKFRHMVGGRSQLYNGILTLDLGLLMLISFNTSTFLILVYLLGARLLSGGIDLMRSLESKKNGSPWLVKLLSAIISLVTVILGVIYFRDPDVVVLIYCISLGISAIEHFIAAFRRSKAVTIA